MTVDLAAGPGSTRSDGVVEQAERPVRGVRRWVWFLHQMSIWQWLLIATIAGYTTYFSRVSLDVHNGLGTSAYDYGLYDQGVWLMSRFESPFVTLMGRNLIGDHTSFILVLLVPFFWFLPGPVVLLVGQSLVIALGAVPVFLLARRLLGNEALAWVMACCYLLHPAVGWTNRENFHPDSFIGVLIGMAIYAAVERRWRMYVVFVVLALLVKEDASLVVVPLGVWVALKRNVRIGVATILGSLAFMAVAMFVVMRSLIGVPTRNAWRVPFGGPSGFLKTVFTDPLAVLRHYRSDGRPWYLWQMTFPVAWMFLRAPSVALISAAVLAANMLSTFWYQYQIEYHYALVAVPALVMGTVWAISKVAARWRSVLVLVVLCTSMWSAWAWGAVPFSRDVPYSWPPDHPVAVAAREIIEVVPDDASVAAQHAITAHLADRREIYMFPTPFSAELYGVDDALAYQRLPAADRVEFVVIQANLEPDDMLVWGREAGSFTLIAANDWWRVYQRTSTLDSPTG